jgi:hypothetical protein
MSSSRNSSSLGRQSTLPGARENWGSRPGNTSIWSDQFSSDSGDQSVSQRDSWSRNINWGIPPGNHGVWQDSCSRDTPISLWGSGSHDITWGQLPGNTGIWQDSFRDRELSNPPSSQRTSHWDSSGKHGFSARGPPRPNYPSFGSHPLLGARFHTGTDTTSSQPQQDSPPETASSTTNKDAPKARLTLAQYAARKRVRVYNFLCLQSPNVKVI